MKSCCAVGILLYFICALFKTLERIAQIDLSLSMFAVLVTAGANSAGQQVIRMGTDESTVVPLPAQLLMLGDSITQFSFSPGGMGAALADLYQRKLDVISRGYGGYTSDHLRFVLPHIFTSETPIQICTLLIGANDIAGDVEPVHYSGNLAYLVQSFFDTRAKFNKKLEQNTFYDPVLLIIEPFHRLDRSLSRSRQFASSANGIANIFKAKYPGRVGFVETHDAMIKESNRLFRGSFEEKLRQFMPDGVHPNAAGYAFLTRQIKEVLINDMPHLLPANLPISMPFWPPAGFPELPPKTKCSPEKRALWPANQAFESTIQGSK